MIEQPGDALTESLGYWLCRLEREMHAAFTRGFAPLGVSTPEWLVLAQISRGLETPAVLADDLGVDRAAVTRLVGQLMSKGLVRSVPHPSDGRSTILMMTCQGASLLPKLVEASRTINASFLGQVSDQESATLLRLVRKVAGQFSRGCPMSKNPRG